MNRSIHNYPVKYDGGRHWQGRDKSFNDLVIFYYGNADLSEAGIKRKMQIHAKLSPTEQNAMSQYHIVDPVATRDRIREHRQFSRDLRGEIAPILEHNRRITGQEF
jgi:hypothetical protein